MRVLQHDFNENHGSNNVGLQNQRLAVGSEKPKKDD